MVKPKTTRTFLQYQYYGPPTTSCADYHSKRKRWTCCADCGDCMYMWWCFTRIRQSFSSNLGGSHMLSIYIFFEFHGTLFTLLTLDHLLWFCRTIHNQQWIQKLAVPSRQQKLQKWREISRWSAAQFCKIDPIKGNYITCVSCVAWWIIWSFDADFGFVYVGACVIMQGLTPSWRTSSPLPRLTSLLVFFSAGVKRFIPKQ